MDRWYVYLVFFFLSAFLLFLANADSVSAEVCLVCNQDDCYCDRTGPTCYEDVCGGGMCGGNPSEACICAALGNDHSQSCCELGGGAWFGTSPTDGVCCDSGGDYFSGSEFGSSAGCCFSGEYLANGDVASADPRFMCNANRLNDCPAPTPYQSWWADSPMSSIHRNACDGPIGGLYCSGATGTYWVGSDPCVDPNPPGCDSGLGLANGDTCECNAECSSNYCNGSNQCDTAPPSCSAPSCLYQGDCYAPSTSCTAGPGTRTADNAPVGNAAFSDPRFICSDGEWISWQDGQTWGFARSAFICEAVTLPGGDVCVADADGQGWIPINTPDTTCNGPNCPNPGCCSAGNEVYIPEGGLAWTSGNQAEAEFICSGGTFYGCKLGVLAGGYAIQANACDVRSGLACVREPHVSGSPYWLLPGEAPENLNNAGNEFYCEDEIDNDCDGQIDCNDNECSVDRWACCFDNDGDNSASTSACNYGGLADCNDNNDAIYPGATEICDGVDNDCDGQIDEDNVCCVANVGDSCQKVHVCTDGEVVTNLGTVQCDGSCNAVDPSPADCSCSVNPAPSSTCNECGDRSVTCSGGSWVVGPCAGDSGTIDTQSCTAANSCSGEQTRSCDMGGNWGSWGACSATENFCDTDCDGSADTCQVGACPVCNCDVDAVGSCNDANACTTDSCVFTAGVGSECSNIAISCDDSNSCTTDSCDVALGCQNVPDDLNTCTDGYCSAGVCEQTDLTPSLSWDPVTETLRRTYCSSNAFPGTATVPPSTALTYYEIIGTSCFSDTWSDAVLDSALQGGTCITEVRDLDDLEGCGFVVDTSIDYGTTVDSDSVLIEIDEDNNNDLLTLERVCIPTCGPANECGPDGCGGSCGQCSAGEYCSNNVCTVAPSCTDTCGSLGLTCGDIILCDAAANCGSCSGSDVCVNNLCCSPDCSPGNEGLPDGCGGFCPGIDPDTCDPATMPPTVACGDQNGDGDFCGQQIPYCEGGSWVYGECIADPDLSCSSGVECNYDGECCVATVGDTCYTCHNASNCPSGGTACRQGVTLCDGSCSAELPMEPICPGGCWDDRDNDGDTLNNEDDPDCLGALTINVYDPDGIPITDDYDVTFRAAGPAIDEYEATQSGSPYTFADVLMGAYIVSAWVPEIGFGEESVTINPYGESSIDIYLDPNFCRGDCTGPQGMCTYDCLAQGGCTIDSDITGDISHSEELQDLLIQRCAGAFPGERRSIPQSFITQTGRTDLEDTQLVCCTGQFSEFSPQPATVESCAENLVRFTRIVEYGGRPLRLNVLTWDSCE